MKSVHSIKQFVYIATAVASLCALQAEAALVAHWSFDEENGTNVSDSAGNFNGTLSPTGSSLVSGGIAGGAVSLNRSQNGYVTMGNVLGLTSGDFSLVAWMKMNPGDQTQDCVLLGKHAAFYRNGYLIHVNQSTGLAMQSANKTFFYEGGTGVGQLQTFETPISTTSVNDGNWHQIVAVYRAGQTKSIYVDGAPAEDTKPSQDFYGNDVSFMIGGITANGIPEGRITALVDEVQVYNHALSTNDIDYLYRHPTETVPDCPQIAAALQAQLAAANATIANLQNQLAIRNDELQGARNELTATDNALAHLTQHFQALFRNPGFQIQGVGTAAKTSTLVNGIEAENKGTKQQLYDLLRR